jgi:hypothetical protein
MAKKEAYTAGEIIAALQAGQGYVSAAAKALGCNPRTVYNYRDRYKSVAEAWAAIREARHDFVENALHSRIKDGDTTAIIFYLKTQCKSRGYVERQEITGAKGAPLVISWESDTSDDD